MQRARLLRSRSPCGTQACEGARMAVVACMVWGVFRVFCMGATGPSQEAERDSPDVGSQTRIVALCAPWSHHRPLLHNVCLNHRSRCPCILSQLQPNGEPQADKRPSVGPNLRAGQPECLTERTPYRAHMLVPSAEPARLLRRLIPHEGQGSPPRQALIDTRPRKKRRRVGVGFAFGSRVMLAV